MPKRDPNKKSVAIQFRLPEKLKLEMADAIQAEGYASESAFLRAAVTAHIQKGKGNTAEERFVKSVDRLERRVSGIRSSMQLQFSAIAALAEVFFLYTREPADMVLNENQRAMYERMQKFQQRIIQQYHADAGPRFKNEIDGESAEDRRLAVGAGD